MNQIVLLLKNIPVWKINQVITITHNNTSENAIYLSTFYKNKIL